ncbi:hypothetical protein TRFO_12597 [Tritrichomonas foetus]|uniref:Uncharacterized protein n=1 Tax=Tritrichomonas foetus TaxID=1144522 RepID=A0A1J4L153_9EUKA|nr:hypothetical protein TRFO_12597 [Tritrichomonas foetus]|eukprot:OHT17247.1 hypothetical protein TRFO_12597 [Tritrichomonas foetus]
MMLWLLAILSACADSNPCDQLYESEDETFKFCLSDKDTECSDYNEIYREKCFLDYKFNRTQKIEINVPNVYSKRISLNKFYYGSIITFRNRMKDPRANEEEELRNITVVFDVTDPEKLIFVDLTEARVIPASSGNQMTYITLSSAESSSFLPGNGNGPSVYFRKFDYDSDKTPLEKGVDFSAFKEVNVPQDWILQFPTEKSAKTVNIRIGESQKKDPFIELVNGDLFELKIRGNIASVVVNGSTLILDGDLVKSTTTFNLGDVDFLSPTLILDYQNSTIAPSKAPFFLITTSQKTNWVINVKSNEWKDSIYTRIIGKSNTMNIEESNMLSVILNSQKPGIEFDRPATILHLYLNQSYSTISCIKSVKQNYNTFECVHLHAFTAEDPTLYIAESQWMKYYSDSRNKTINVIIGESTKDQFYTPNAKYMVQNIVDFEIGVTDDYSTNIYKYGVFYDDAEAPYNVNDFMSFINNMEILDEALIDLSSTKKPLILNQNISFPGSKYYIQAVSDDFSLNSINDNFHNYPGKHNEDKEGKERQYYVLCQPDLDCNKFEISLKSSIYYRNPESYWQDESMFTPICHKYTEIYSQKDASDNPCCPNIWEMNDATQRMVCIGFQANEKYLSKYSKGENLQSEGNYKYWVDSIYEGITGASFKASHPVPLLDHCTFYNINFETNSNTMLIGTNYADKFNNVECQNSIYFRFSDRNDNILPFKSLTVSGEILNQNLSAINWSIIQSLQLDYKFYEANHLAFKTINDITIRGSEFYEKIQEVLKDISDRGKDEYKENENETIFLIFSDTGITVSWGTLEVKVLTLYPNQRYRHIIMTEMQFEKDVQVVFQNLAVDYDIKLKESKVNTGTLYLSEDIQPKLINFEASQLNILYTKDSADQKSFRHQIREVSSIEIDTEVEEEVKGEFNFGSISASNKVIIQFKNKSQKFSSFKIEQLTLSSPGDEPIQVSGNGIPKYSSITVAILTVAGDHQSITYDDFNVSGTINTQSSSVYINQPYTRPNLNMTFSDSLSLDMSNNTNLGKVTLHYSGSKKSCDSTEEIYRRIYKSKFTNVSYSHKFGDYHFLTCQKAPRWTYFTNETEFDYCPYQKAKLIVKEFRDVTKEDVEELNMPLKDLDKGVNYTCLAYTFDYSSVDSSLTKGFYKDVIENGERKIEYLQ